MEYNQTTASVYNEPSMPQKLPSFLNVLTILTIIGSIWGILQAIGSPIINNKMKAQNERSYEKLEQVNTNDTTKSKGENAVLSFAKNSVEIARVMQKNEISVAAVSTIAALLCLGGAFLMRKQKKVGFYLYLVGEWAAVIFTCVLIGSLPGAALFIAFPIVIALIFTVLYFINFKHLNQ